MPTHIEPGVRIPIPLYDVLKRLADKNHRSLNAEVIVALEQYVQPFIEHEQRRDQVIASRLEPVGPDTSGAHGR